MHHRRLLAAAPIALALALVACGDQQPATTSTREAAIAPMVAPPEGKAWHEVVSMTPEGGYAMGNPDAPIKLIEYGAVTCSHCAAFEQSGFAPLKADYVDSGRVRFELRNFILNAYDIPITLLTRCDGPEKYFPLTEQAFQDQEAMMAPAIKLSDSNPQVLQDAMNRPVDERFYELGKAIGVVDFFQARGVSKDKARACLTDQKAMEQLLSMTEAGSNMGVTGTPTFFLNGEKIQVDHWDDLKPHLAAAGAR